jgi:uncharacterized protein (TIGR02145 family)
MKKHVQKSRCLLLVAIIFLVLNLPLFLSAQTVIGGENPDSSALLDLQSSQRGFLLPRLTTLKRDSISKPASGLMIWNITTNCLQFNAGTPNIPDWRCLTYGPPGPVQSLDCSGIVVNGSLKALTAAGGVSFTIPYIGGDGSNFRGLSINSDSISGLVATLSPGIINSGNGLLSFSISGTPRDYGTAVFNVVLGGGTCLVPLAVAVNVDSVTSCGAYIAPGEWKEFMCRNLGVANPNADFLKPSWEINGGYWQWGRKEMAAAGPSGSGAGQANDGAVAGWNTIGSANDSWSDATKTANDPCPVGYRLPTRTQFTGLIANNVISNIGSSWTISATNYATGKTFGFLLFLPAAGHRSSNDGALGSRGSSGEYWGSTSLTLPSSGGHLFFDSNSLSTKGSPLRIEGMSVRCIKE